MTARLERAYAVLAVFAVLALTPHLDHWGRTLLFPWCVGLLVGGLACAWQLRRVHHSLAWLAAVVVTNAALSFAYVGDGSSWSLAHVGNAAYSVAAFAGVVAFGLVAPYGSTRKAFVLAGIVTSSSIVIKTLLHFPEYARWEFIGNPSMTGCFIACVLPLSIVRSRSALHGLINVAVFALYLAAVYAIGAVIPWLCLLAVLFTALFRECKIIRPFLIACAALAVTTYVLVIHKLENVEAVNDSGRFHVWAIGLGHWFEARWYTKLFGFGLGSTQTNLIKWYPTDGHRDFWLWFHNDWLQLLVETGTVGLCAAAQVGISAAKRAWRTDTARLASLVGVAVWGAANYPARLAFTALFCGWLVISLLRPVNQLRQKCDMV